MLIDNRNLNTPSLQGVNVVHINTTTVTVNRIDDCNAIKGTSIELQHFPVGSECRDYGSKIEDMKEEQLERVNDMTILKGMLRANLIVFARQTGTKITGLYDKHKFTCTYIDEAVGSNRFDYKGNQYKVQYVSGCFNPYVFKII